MCNHVAFTAWLYLAEDQHPSALRAMALDVPVDPDETEAAIIETEEKGKQNERETVSN